MASKAEDLNKKYEIDIESFNIPKNVFEYTPMYIEEEYGVTPKELIDLKALVGDTSDNIPGVKGIGEKSAIPLIKEYGTIENLYDTIRDLDKKEEKAIKEFWKSSLGIAKSPLNYLLKVGENSEDILGERAAIISKTLGEIRLDAPIKYTLEDLNYSFEENMGNIKDVFQEYEFKSLLKTYFK